MAKNSTRSIRLRAAPKSEHSLEPAGEPPGGLPVDQLPPQTRRKRRTQDDINTQEAAGGASMENNPPPAKRIRHASDTVVGSADKHAVDDVPQSTRRTRQHPAAELVSAPTVEENPQPQKQTRRVTKPPVKVAARDAAQVPAPPKRKRRTAAEVQAEKDAKAAAKKEHEDGEAEARRRIAQVEDDLVRAGNKIERERVTRPTSQRQANLQDLIGLSELPSEDETADDRSSLTEYTESGLTDNEQPKKRARKKGVRADIVNARQTPSTAAAGEWAAGAADVLDKATQDAKNPNFGLGEVKDWKRNLPARWGSATGARGTTQRMRASNAPVGQLAASTSTIDEQQSQYLQIQTAQFASDDEAVERFDALSSPEKGRDKRLMNASLVEVDEVDPDETPRPLRRTSAKQVLVKTEDGSQPEFHMESTVKPSIQAVGASRQQVKTVRTTENTIVKVEESEQEGDLDPKTKPAKGKKNVDLPMGAKAGQRWLHVFLPTLMKYMGTLDNPWVIGDAELVDALQIIWNTVYPRLEYEVRPDNDCAVFNVAGQRIYDWRCGFGSTAAAVVELYLQKHQYDTEAKRRDAAIDLVQNMRFAYDDAEGDDYQTFKGLFRGELVTRTLIYHYQKMKGAINVPTLYGEDGDRREVGAVGISAAAVERILVFWQTGAIRLTQNPTTGVESTWATQFSADNYDKNTADFIQSAVDSLSEKKFVKLMSKVEQYAKPSSQSLGLHHDLIEISDDEDLNVNHRKRLIDAEVDSD
ncbi:hypothetical protein BKA93DRAFT_753308 [Sparassis latifolia]